MIYIGLINNEIKLAGSDVEAVKDGAFALGISLDSIEATDNEIVTAWDGKMYFKGEEPEKPVPTIAEQNEAIRATREQLYIQTSDKLRNDYLEAVARDADNVEELKVAWLESKDKIRAENPYIVEEVSTEA